MDQRGELPVSLVSSHTARNGHQLYSTEYPYGMCAEFFCSAIEHPFQPPDQILETLCLGDGSTEERGWLDRLRWDPLTDNWRMAQSKMNNQVYPSPQWDDQPVHQ